MDEEKDECIICFDELIDTEIKKLKCNHIYHNKCINDWLNKKNTCPICMEKQYNMCIINIEPIRENEVDITTYDIIIYIIFIFVLIYLLYII